MFVNNTGHRRRRVFFPALNQIGWARDPSIENNLSQWKRRDNVTQHFPVTLPRKALTHAPVVLLMVTYNG